jgi:hypothetical protein
VSSTWAKNVGKAALEAGLPTSSLTGFLGGS